MSAERQAIVGDIISAIRRLDRLEEYNTIALNVNAMQAIANYPENSFAESQAIRRRTMSRKRARHASRIAAKAQPARVAQWRKMFAFAHP